MAQSPEDRPATAAELGDELRQTQRRHGVIVDDMAVPTDTEDPRAERSPAPQRVGPVVTPVRVVVAEDDVLLREGLASLLDRSGFEVVGQAGDGAQLLAWSAMLRQSWW